MLRWSDITTRIRFEPILGVLELNELSTSDFLDKLKYYVTKFVTKTNGKYGKYDIDGGIFSRLQNNKNFDKQKYALISSLREKMWISDDKFLTEEEVNVLLTIKL